MTVVHGRDDLSEEMAGLVLAEPRPLTDVVVQVAPAGVLHDDHNLAAVLKHWGRARWDCQALPECAAPPGGSHVPPPPPTAPKPDRTFLQGYLLTGWDGGE